MADGNRVARFIRLRARLAGRTYERARHAYRSGHDEVIATEDPEEQHIVCRRFAERRIVVVDTTGRPHCFEGNHPDCEGCREDIIAGRIETWTE